jgi:hypothetical protein
MTNLRARWTQLVLLVVATAAAAACGTTGKVKGELRFVTDSFMIRVIPESLPTRALEPIYWRIIVNERKTGTPVQGGQGRIFATSQDRHSIANGLEETEELGTYRTNLLFVTAGMWAMAVQFRRDSTMPLQRTQDWTQQLLTANEPGDFTPPGSMDVDTTQKRTAPADSAKIDTSKSKGPPE